MIYTEPQPRINLILSELILDIIMMLHSDIDQTIFSFLFAATLIITASIFVLININIFSYLERISCFVQKLIKSPFNAVGRCDDEMAAKTNGQYIISFELV